MLITINLFLGVIVNYSQTQRDFESTCIVTYTMVILDHQLASKRIAEAVPLITNVVRYVCIQHGNA